MCLDADSVVCVWMLPLLCVSGCCLCCVCLEADSVVCVWMLPLLSASGCCLCCVCLDVASVVCVWMLTLLCVSGCCLCCVCLDADSVVCVWMLTLLSDGFKTCLQNDPHTVQCFAVNIFVTQELLLFLFQHSLSPSSTLFWAT